MGQYFYFFHETKGENKKNLSFQEGHTWVAKLLNYDEECIKKFFEEVISLNNWPPGDIEARGDDGDLIIYTKDKNLITWDQDVLEYIMNKKLHVLNAICQFYTGSNEELWTTEFPMDIEDYNKFKDVYEQLPNHIYDSPTGHLVFKLNNISFDDYMDKFIENIKFENVNKVTLINNDGDKITFESREPIINFSGYKILKLSRLFCNKYGITVRFKFINYFGHHLISKVDINNDV